jgi:hypothetical protein
MATEPLRLSKNHWCARLRLAVNRFRLGSVVTTILAFASGAGLSPTTVESDSINSSYQTQRLCGRAPGMIAVLGLPPQQPAGSSENAP